MEIQKKISINELNTFLKGEYMAIDSYEKYIRKLKDPSVKSDMEKIVRDHRNHASAIANRIEALGGKASKTVGFSGMIGEIANTIKNVTLRTPEQICETAYYWEDKGIKMAEEVVKGDLDETSENIIRNILATDRSHLDSLRSHLKN